MSSSSLKVTAGWRRLEWKIDKRGSPYRKGVSPKSGYGYSFVVWDQVGSSVHLLERKSRQELRQMGAGGICKDGSSSGNMLFAGVIQKGEMVDKELEGGLKGS
jgi:hypothetical protein